MKYTLGSIGVALDKGRFVGRRLALLQFEHGLTQIRELPSAELLEPLDVLFPHIFVVSGGPGHGKSALLRQFELVARAEPENEPVLVAVDLSAEPGLLGPLDLLQVLHDALFQLGFEAEFEAFRDVVARRVEIVRQLDDAQRAYITLLSARQSDAIDALRGGRLDAPALASWLLGREDLDDSRDPFIQHLRRRMSAEDWELLTDPAQIAASFVEATNAIARRDRPLVLLVELETGGEQRLDWLRRWVLPETGLHTLWVLAGDFDANQINSMRDDFVEEMLARVPLEPLSRLEVSSYLRQYSPRPGAAPNRAFVRAVQQISKGMPLAVEVLAYLHKAGVDVKNVFDELRATDAPLGERLRAFLALFVELGVVSAGRAASGNGEADRRRLWLYCVALLRRFDPAVLGVMLTAAGQDADVEAVRAELKEAYHFLFGASRNSVHPLVRDILRGCFWSDEPDESKSKAARAAAGFYRQRLDEIGADHDVGQRHELGAWREATLDYISALFWASPAGKQSRGAFFRALIEAAVFHRLLASDLLAVAALHAEHDAELGEHCDRVAALLAQAAPEPGDPRVALASLEALEAKAEQWEFTPLHHALLALLKAQRLVAAGRAGEAIEVLQNAAAPELQSRTAALLSQIGWQAVRMGGETALDEARRAFEAAAGFAPHAGDPLLGQGAVQFAARDFEAAQEHVRRAIDVGGERDHALIWLGHVNYASGHYGKATSAFQQAVELQPRSPDAHAGAGYVLLRLGHPQDAQAAFERAIEYDDEYAIAHNGLGDAVAGLGDRARAESAYRRAIDLDEHYALPHKGLGSLMLSFGRHEQAQAQFEAAIALGGLDELQLAEAHNGLGMAHFHQGRYAESMASYQYAIELAPDHAPSHVGLGQVLLHLGRHAEALTACERGIELDPRFAFGHYTLGDIYRAQGQPKAAIIAYERAVAEDPDYAAPHTGLGSLYAELERYPDAISAFQRAFNLSGLNEYELALAHKGLGAVYQEQGNVAEAIRAYRQALALNVLDDRNRALTFSALGDLHRGSAQYEEAIEAYQQAVDVGVLSGSELARVHSGLGTAHRAQNRPDEALVSYRLAMVLDPKYAYPHNGLGNIHYVRGEFEEAIHAYQRAIELDSEYAHPYNGLGNVFADLGRHTEAVQSYQRAIETGGVDNHELAIFYNGLGNSYADQGELEPAIEAYLRAVELDREYAFPHSGLGSAYADLGNYESALEAFQHAVELGGLGDRELAVVYSGIGNVQRDLGDYQSAIENYQQAIVLHPKDPTPHTGLAIACRAVGEYEAA
ncbi:MAG: tetratricopeptide repeat protein, partial [Anaerolineales bacterium]